MLIGIIDVGSHTIRLSVFKVETDGTFIPVTDKKVAIGLAGYEEDGTLNPAGEAKLCKCLLEFKHITSALEVAQVYVFATESLRRVSNAEQVITQIYAQTGLSLELLSGEAEARLSFLGAQYSTSIEDGLVIDIGGASCELIQAVNGSIEELYSIPIGCLSLSLQSGSDILPDHQEIQSMKAVIDRQLATVAGLFKEPAPTLCFVGGTARAAYRIAREFKPRDARYLEPDELEAVIAGLNRWDAEVIKAVRLAAPERVFTISAGLLIMQAVIQASHPTTLLVSKCGIREGYLIDNVIKG